ncbi:thiamine pyrophosphate-requiring protein [Wenxinia marina]|uniref:Thiamine pyrophosphate-requiring enzyme n=1 Tax=Wenxinia marina DSM 24838 TaxID=1123501 RepID=A0A0D0NJ03_9RHOB|nr:thiamine pyrophosphate-requiring protein [Wenxinia marina]KIQ68305.1 Thiamine pyrophosphate-requiring enzyme [Wenxinia marina DSM 24838]GGL79614.1 acetolactate synthase [Wenxinia marina]
MKDARPDSGFAAEEILGRLKASGIDVLLANGGTDFPSIIEALAGQAESGIEMPEALVVTHEGVALGMAHGYYLASGKPAAVMVHVNVGLANAVMGLINAASDRIPVLMLSGRTPLTEAGRFGSRNSPIHWGQEMRDQAAMIREVVKWDYELRYPEQGVLAVDRALSVAQSEPKGPVYLSLPREVLAEAAPAGGRAAAPPPAPVAYGAPPPDLVAEAARILAQAERPVIITQGIDVRGFEPLAGLAERWALPVVEYWSTRQALPTSHPMHGGREPTDWVKDADAILTVDAMVPWITDHVQPPEGCRVIALGPDPSFRAAPMRSFPADLTLAGGTLAGLQALDAAMGEPPAERTDALAARRERVSALRDDRVVDAVKRAEAGSGTPMSPAWVGRCLNEAAGPEAIYFNELGIDPTVMQFDEPGTFFSSPLSGGLGWGLPAAMGAALADRSRTVIACVGDGSYMFANPVACHQTCAAHGLPVLTVVFNNGIWNAVRRSTLYMYPDGKAAAANVMPITALEGGTDHAAIARAHGAHAERVSDGADLPAAIGRALAATKAGQQALLEVMVSY